MSIRPEEGGAPVVLGTIERADEGAFALDVEIPALPPGRYLIEAESSGPAGVTATDPVQVIDRR